KPRSEIVIAWKKSIGIEKKAKWKSKTRLKTERNRKIPKKEEEALEQEKPENQRVPSSNT
ncbi:2146_t:CDS:1, partial [Gigaspora margarita]